MVSLQLSATAMASCCDAMILQVWAGGNSTSCVQGWFSNVMGGPVAPRQTFQDAACCVQKRLRSPAPRREALALSQAASAAERAAKPSTAAASLGDVAQAAPACGLRGGRAAKVRRRCSPASQPAVACLAQLKAAPLAGTAAGTNSGVDAAGMAEPEVGPTLQQAAADPAQLEAAPLAGTEAGTSSGVHVAGMAEPEVGPTSQQAAADPAQLKAAHVPRTAADSATGVRTVGVATVGPSAAIAEQCPGQAPGCAGSYQQRQLPAEGLNLQPGSPGPPAEPVLGTCAALAEQPLPSSTPVTCQAAEQGKPEAACAEPGRLTAQQQVQEAGAAPAPPSIVGGGQHGCTELPQGLSTRRDGAEAAGPAEDMRGRPLAAGPLHSTTQAGTPPAQGVRHNCRVNLLSCLRCLCGAHHVACVATQDCRHCAEQRERPLHSSTSSVAGVRHGAGLSAHDACAGLQVTFSVPVGGGEPRPRPLPVRRRGRPCSPAGPSVSRPSSSRWDTCG